MAIADSTSLRMPGLTARQPASAEPVSVAKLDAEIIAASRDDPERFALLFDRHYAAISRFLRRRLPATIADEAASEAFLIAFERRGTFDPGRGSALAWLYGIASNLIRRHRRSEVRRIRAYRGLGTDPAGGDSTAETIARADASRERRPLAEALSALSADERDVLLLYAWADLGYREIACALEVPIGTVRSRLARARRRIGELISADGQEQDGGDARMRSET